MNLKLKLFALGLFALTATAIAYHPGHFGSTATPERPAPQHPTRPGNPTQEAPRIEAVFVLDTTGSMGGMIEAAKQKIWSIASTMASAQPAPVIRMGLVAYRDRGDDYVTRVVDLSDDLDSVHATLIEFSAAGGGDGPESVNQALDDAINRISWSQDSATYRVVFLVGDAPPHMDYADEKRYPAIVAEAVQRGIVINTIRCGSNPETAEQWRTIAAATQGKYFSVEQSGSAIAMTTPYDAELARLSADLDATRVYYGDEETRAEKESKMAATEKLHRLAGDAALARRATFNVSSGGDRNQFGEGDLVSDVAEGTVELSELEPAALPEPLRTLPAESLEKMLSAKQERRDALKREIGRLAEAREAYLEEQVEELSGREASLDHQILETVRQQGASRGLTYSAAPKY